MCFQIIISSSNKTIYMTPCCPLKIRLFVEGDKSVINSLPEVGLHSSLLGPNVPISFNCFPGWLSLNLEEDVYKLVLPF